VTEPDLIVLGLGLAGVCAALEAVESGLSVTVVEALDGGGAGADSGGQLYLGGGTRHQAEAGFADTPEGMYAYLERETRGAVSPETLRRFCETSVANLEWLEAHGVPFDGTLCPVKTSYPVPGTHLHYSGNEQASAFAAVTPPVPRSHRPVGEGMTGYVLLERLIAAAEERGVRILRRHRAVGLEPDPAGGVPRLRVEPPGAEQATFAARAGIVLATGGFQFSRELVARHAPAYLPGNPQGVPTNTGAGIALGIAAGGDVAHLSSTAAWIFVTPPTSMVRGLLVGPSGRRVCDETLYGATIGRHVVEEHAGLSWLLVDDPLLARIRAEVETELPPGQMADWVRTRLNDDLRSGDTLAEAATAAGIDPEGLQATVAEYLAADTDPLGKAAVCACRPETGPYHLVPFPYAGMNFMTLGGLVVDEETGEVVRPDGSRVAGLYAAGRDAVGVCSLSYVSGLSLADCVFSGRRAGSHVAARVGVGTGA